MDTEDYCGMDLFTDFTFEDITKANPPDKKGVYVIKVKKRGLPPDEIIHQLTTHIAGLRWEMVQAYLTSHIARITNITECPVIYLGSAGTGKKSRAAVAELDAVRVSREGMGQFLGPDGGSGFPVVLRTGFGNDQYRL